MHNLDKSTSLNKYISSSGYCSRREADRLIEQGRVLLNGTSAQKGNRVSPGDKVIVDGSKIKVKPVSKKLIIAFNKPVGVICTTDRNDPNNIIDFINYPKRIFPIGRLDKDSDGLILLTNDGDIVNKILRSENKHEKEYFVTVDKKITPEFIKKMGDGVRILGTVTNKCEVKKVNARSFRIILTQGLNRQIRRMCEHLGYKVKDLSRTRIMHIKLDGLEVGRWRHLIKEEFELLESTTSGSTKTSTKSKKVRRKR